jgi:hypothetical protein
MTDRSIKKRISDLENRNPDRPIMPVYQSYDDPSLWHTSPDQRQTGEAIPWDELVKRYPDHNFIQVQYTDNWRGTENDK